MKDVVKAGVFIKNMDDSAINEVYAEYLGDVKPATVFVLKSRDFLKMLKLRSCCR